MILREPGGDRAANGPGQVVAGEAVHAECKGGAARAFERSPGRILTSGQGPIDAEGILGRCRLLEEAGDFQLDGRIVGRIARGNQKLSARRVQFAAGDQVPRHLQANLATAVVAIALPGAVQCRLVMKNGL